MSTARILPCILQAATFLSLSSQAFERESVMPWAPKRPCTFPGCPELTTTGRCYRHARAQRDDIDRRRGTAASRGYNSRWQAARERYLKLHPVCGLCALRGVIVAATVVDHIDPHKGNQAKFWDESNWQALCKSCHDRKTTKEGRWGGLSKSLA